MLNYAYCKIGVKVYIMPDNLDSLKELAKELSAEFVVDYSNVVKETKDGTFTFGTLMCSKRLLEGCTRIKEGDGIVDPGEGKPLFVIDRNDKMIRDIVAGNEEAIKKMEKELSGYIKGNATIDRETGAINLIYKKE